jgi:argininosuccinate lyase
MPQKKNPDSLELIRGKAGRVFGHHAALLATMKGLPLAYNKDMQEDKEALFDTVDTLAGSLGVMATVLRNVRVNAQRMRMAATGNYSTATDLADYLVRRGMEFRRAHELVGRIVTYAIEQGKSLVEISLDDYRNFSELFDQDLYADITILSSLISKGVLGGTSPAQVKQALSKVREEMDEESV